MIINGECPQELKEENYEFAMMGENKNGNGSLSIEKFVLEEFLHKDLRVIQSCLSSMRDIQQHDLKVTTLEPLKSDFDTKPSKGEENILIKRRLIKIVQLIL